MECKKRKLTFSSNHCCFCQTEFMSSDKQVLNPKKFDAFLLVCKDQTDEISQNIVTNEENIRNGTIQLSYHKNCRTYFLRQNSRSTNEEDESDELTTPTKFTRSKSDSFDWKQKCFLCGNNCSNKHRSKWSRVEGSIGLNSKMFSQLLDISLSKNHTELHKRLLSCNGDLVAVEARYHRGSKKNCLSRYLLGANQTPEKAKDDSNLEKVCLMLKNEMQAEMENDKCVIEAVYLRSKVIELSERHKLEIGKTMLRTSRLKIALEKVWPELIFIPRDGETDLVCLHDIGVKEAIARYRKLQKSLESSIEEENILEDMSNAFFDENANDLTLLHEAAILLRKRIQETKGLQNEYFSKEELQLDHQAKFIDPVLLKFVCWISDDSLSENCESNNVMNKRVVSVCSDITYLVTNVVTPKHLGLSIYLHHAFGSRKLIDDLHNHGYTLSYSEYRHFLTSAALHMASRQQQTLSGTKEENLYDNK